MDRNRISAQKFLKGLGLPTWSQWIKWSKPSKASYASFLVAVVLPLASLVIGLLVPLWGLFTDHEIKNSIRVKTPEIHHPFIQLKNNGSKSITIDKFDSHLYSVCSFEESNASNIDKTSLENWERATSVLNYGRIGLSLPGVIIHPNSEWKSTNLSIKQDGNIFCYFESSFQIEYSPSYGIISFIFDTLQYIGILDGSYAFNIRYDGCEYEQVSFDDVRDGLEAKRLMILGGLSLQCLKNSDPAKYDRIVKNISDQENFDKTVEKMLSEMSEEEFVQFSVDMAQLRSENTNEDFEYGVKFLGHSLNLFQVCRIMYGTLEEVERRNLEIESLRRPSINPDQEFAACMGIPIPLMNNFDIAE